MNISPPRSSPTCWRISTFAPSSVLVVAGGETVQIVCVAEVEDWLTSLASRVDREGLKLRAAE